MVRSSQKFDITSLHKLLKFAKSFEEAYEKSEGSPPLNRVLVRTTPEGNLTFQVKGGALWRLFAITLPGREQEYDLAHNFQRVQALFSELEGFSDEEIRRASQRIEIAADTQLPQGDVIASLKKLQETLNSIIEHVKQKKASKESDETRKTHIIEACDRMLIRWSTAVKSPKTRKPSLVKTQLVTSSLGKESA